jgi:hypothetical protein
MKAVAAKVLPFFHSMMPVMTWGYICARTLLGNREP